ncbi:phage baseplate protein [Psychroflexus sp. ALD_RP9]|uniref:phage baseplate protein n=1 Tax=Psychroflexus sp. ALD_RP9 TaxID=2777186 RepID=UPI001A8C35C8|nr:hypothetical protein [Psychroflexus sp. ALD_RP9]QSS96575.1 hypothetical protein IMZ30_08990 [Psychroflexus sp. ALD_RP9]
MKTIHVEGGGFPGTSKTWRHIAEMIQQVADTAAASLGDNAIITGVENTGSTISNGIVVINGEIFTFQGGQAKTHVEIIQQVEQTQYLKDADGDGSGDIIDTYFERYAKLTNTAEGNVALSDFKRLKTQLELSKRIHPQTVQMYFGSITDIEQGWQLCDGTNGTPDLSGRFVVGLDPNDDDYNEIGKSGGSKRHTLTQAEMPQHNHSGNTNPAGNHRHQIPNDNTLTPEQVDTTNGEYGGFNNNNNPAYTDYEPSHTHSFTTNNKGSSQPHENRPPYFTLAYITYVGN